MLTGVVKWFNDAKGFGFIEHTSGQDVFVHYSVIEWDGFKTLKDGENVEYELKEGQKGLHAAIVRRPNAKMSEAEKTAKAARSDTADNTVHDNTVHAHQHLSEQIEVESSKHSESKIIFGKIANPKETDTDFPEQ